VEIISRCDGEKINADILAEEGGVRRGREGEMREGIQRSEVRFQRPACNGDFE
jgi:hypothetical protein